MYTIGTLFSGIGVPDLCGRLLGMTTLWQVEIEEFPELFMIHWEYPPFTF